MLGYLRKLVCLASPPSSAGPSPPAAHPASPPPQCASCGTRASGRRGSPAACDCKSSVSHSIIYSTCQKILASTGPAQRMATRHYHSTKHRQQSQADAHLQARVARLALLRVHKRHKGKGVSSLGVQRIQVLEPLQYRQCQLPIMRYGPAVPASKLHAVMPSRAAQRRSSPAMVQLLWQVQHPQLRSSFPKADPHEDEVAANSA
jgi:hypothetical protein